MNYKDYFRDGADKNRKDVLPAGVDMNQLKMGIETEMEHTKDKNIAKKIALDHLKEDPKYYTKLTAAGLEEINDVDDIPHKPSHSDLGVNNDNGLPIVGGALAIPHLGQPIHMSKIIQVGSLGGNTTATGVLSGMTSCDKPGVAADRGGIPVKVGGDKEPITAGGKRLDPTISSKSVGGAVVAGGGEKQGGPNSQGTIANTTKLSEDENDSQSLKQGQDITIDLQEQKSKIRGIVKEVLKEITFNENTGKWERLNEYGNPPKMLKQNIGGEPKWVVMDKSGRSKTFDIADYKKAETYLKSVGGGADKNTNPFPINKPSAELSIGPLENQQPKCDRNFGKSHGGFEPNVYQEDEDIQCPEITEMYDAEEESHLQEEYFNLLTKKSLLKESETQQIKKLKDQLERMNERKEKWIQKAIKPSHKGYCTPMTKSTCTPARKALAKRFKSGDLSESMNLDVNKLEDIEVGGVDPSDYPDFVDAYIVSATIGDRQLTDQELDWLNSEHPEIVQRAALEQQHTAGDFAADAAKDRAMGLKEFEYDEFKCRECGKRLTDDEVDQCNGYCYKCTKKQESISEAGGGTVQHKSLRVANDAPQIPKNRHNNTINETEKKSEVHKKIEKGIKGKTTIKKQNLTHKSPKKTKSGLVKKRN
jgi:hypothetical protein